ncbi:MAG: glycosyltransferase family 9 protein [Candidatus Adiutrix sp.]|jgi:ADP-heptose:LPS heptosyltransferase|nr:glycosyltransferase family 9 protein [Candidatus Adiutrix sp.]
MSERLLIIQLAKLGDFIQSTPLLANLRRANPGAEIIVAAEQPAALAAARLSPLVDTAVPIAGDEESLAHLGKVRDVFVLNTHRRAAALAATVPAENQYGPRLGKEGLKFTGAQNFILALMRQRRDFGRFNLVDLWTSLAPGAKPHPLIWPETQPSELLPQDGSLKVGLQMGSRNHLRRWPVEHFVGLTAALNELLPGRAITPVLLGSPGERALGAKFEKMSRDLNAPAPCNLMGRTDLAELGQVVAGLDLLITADTGVMHLAAAVNTPVLALFFGPAYGPETGPYGAGHLIYQAAAPCAPCREGGDCRRRECLEMPQPNLAARLAAGLLTQNAPRLDTSIVWPAGHRVWRTAIDGFGQALRPWGSPPLTADEALIHIITHAGRGLIRPGYATAVPDIQAAISAYQPPASPLAVDGSFLTALAGQAFPASAPDKKKFLESAGILAAAVGLKIA